MDKNKILYVWQGSEYASEVGRKAKNKITFKKFAGLEWKAGSLVNKSDISLRLAEIDSDQADWRCPVRKVFLILLQSSLENTCVGVFL